jgi:RND family efflux transporter MFP subunit
MPHLRFFSLPRVLAAVLSMTRSNARLMIAAVAAVAFVGAGFTYSSYASRPTAPKPAVTPRVGVTPAERRSLPVKLDAQGHLVPLAQVDIRPQATGTVRAIHFKEGDEVKAGQLMFTIDATDVEAQLARSQASAAQVKAQLDEARRDLVRTQELAKSRFYTASAVDTAQSKVEALQGQYAAAQADVDNTRVLVDHTRVTAPMTGLTGALAVHPGSLAQPGATAPLVNLVQMDPIGADFTLPENTLAKVLAARSSGQLEVAAETADGKLLPGKIVFVNNTVDTSTGTISLKASFPNADKRLWPGSFVHLRLVAGADESAVTLPPQSLLQGPSGRFVYVVDANGAVVSKPVSLLRIQDQVAVVDGLDGGERVVSEGQAGLKPGMNVRVSNGTPASGASR